jgi:hypothetical protein
MFSAITVKGALERLFLPGKFFRAHRRRCRNRLYFRRFALAWRLPWLKWTPIVR